MIKLKDKCDIFVIDGNYLKFDDKRHINYKYETIINGDDKVYEISCASNSCKSNEGQADD